MSSINNNIGVAGATPINLSTTDLETALMTVQQQRTKLLDQQLQGQIDVVTERNKQMEGMNDQINGLNVQSNALTDANIELGTQIGELKALQGQLAASKCPNPDGFYGLSWGQGDDKAASHAMLAKVRESGLTVPTGADAPRDVDGNGTMDAKGSVVQGWVDQIDAKVAELQAKIDANQSKITANKDATDGLKKDIDGLSNTQQTDMLRLQSLSNKRGESFDTMTNFIKKMQDSRSSIVGNLK